MIDLPPGLSFSPGDENLVAILRSRISQEPLDAVICQFIHDADVYGAEPPELVAGLFPEPSTTGDSWYFFSFVKAKSSRDSRKCRAVAGGKGTWHSEKARIDVVDEQGRIVGYHQVFTYADKDGCKPGWLMMEFGTNREDDEAGRGCEPVPVLCKIYQTPSKRQSAPNSSTSASSGSKRKRDQVSERSDLASSARVRRQLQFPSAPPPNPPTEDSPPAPNLPPEDFFLLPVDPQQQQPCLEGFLVEPQQQPYLEDVLLPVEPEQEQTETEPEPEPEESFMAQDNRSMLRCNAQNGDASTSWAVVNDTAAPSLGGMETADDLPPVDSQPELETQVLNQGFFFSADLHARSTLNCYGADWATPSCAPSSASWALGHVVASCTQH